MTLDETETFIRNHFEQFVNRKNTNLADISFAAEFVDHAADVPSGTPAGHPGARLIPQMDGSSNSGIVIWRSAWQEHERWGYLKTKAT